MSSDNEVDGPVVSLFIGLNKTVPRRVNDVNLGTKDHSLI